MRPPPRAHDAVPHVGCRVPVPRLVSLLYLFMLRLVARWPREGWVRVGFPPGKGVPLGQLLLPLYYWGGCYCLYYCGGCYFLCTAGAAATATALLGRLLLPLYCRGGCYCHFTTGAAATAICHCVLFRPRDMLIQRFTSFGSQAAL